MSHPLMRYLGLLLECMHVVYVLYRPVRAHACLLHIQRAYPTTTQALGPLGQFLQEFIVNFTLVVKIVSFGFAQQCISVGTWLRCPPSYAGKGPEPVHACTACLSVSCTHFEMV
jgi:hypothetical protein